MDLRQTDLPAGDVPLEIDLGVGDARVIVPDDVCVATDARVGIGEARTFEQHNEGVDVDLEDLPGRPARHHALLVKADVGVGSLRDRPRGDRTSTRGPRHFDFGPDFEELGRNAACARSPDPTSLVAGIAVLALGVLLLLDAGGTLDLRFAVLAPVALRGDRGGPARVRDGPAAMICV